MSKAAMIPDFNPGERVRVVAGPYTGWEGTVLASDGIGQVRAEFVVFGVRTVVELSTSAVERL